MRLFRMLALGMVKAGCTGMDLQDPAGIALNFVSRNDSVRECGDFMFPSAEREMDCSFDGDADD